MVKAVLSRVNSIRPALVGFGPFLRYSDAVGRAEAFQGQSHEYNFIAHSPLFADLIGYVVLSFFVIERVEWNLLLLHHGLHRFAELLCQRSQLTVRESAFLIAPA